MSIPWLPILSYPANAIRRGGILLNPYRIIVVPQALPPTMGLVWAVQVRVAYPAGEYKEILERALLGEIKHNA